MTTEAEAGAGRVLDDPQPVVTADEVLDRTTLWEWTAWMTQMGPRHTGTNAHDAFVAWIGNRLREFGVDAEATTQTFEAWDAERWSLSVVDDAGEAQPVEVCSYFNYSGATPPEGVAGELVDVGSGTAEEVAGRDLTGRIAVVRQRTRISYADLMAYAEQAGMDVTFRPGDDWSTLVRQRLGTMASQSDPKAYERLGFGIHMTPDLTLLLQAGAVGAVVVLEDASPDALRGQWAPILKPVQGLPAVFVDTVAAHALTPGRRAHLVLQATVGQRNTDQLVVDVPGSDLDNEVVLVVTHTDGPNAVDENGPMALLALLKLFAGRRRHANRRRLVFVFATGHCTAGVESVSKVFQERPDLAARVRACLCIEHLGATEWVDTGDGMVATGRPEPAPCYVSDHDDLVAVAGAALEAHVLENVWLMRPLGGRLILGEAAALSLMGLPTIAYLPAPTYLLAMAEHGHLDKLDPERLHREVVALADLLVRLDALP